MCIDKSTDGNKHSMDSRVDDSTHGSDGNMHSMSSVNGSMHSSDNNMHSRVDNVDRSYTDSSTHILTGHKKMNYTSM